MNEGISIPTHGAVIHITSSKLLDLLGVNGMINQVFQDINTGVVSIVMTGDEKHFPPITVTEQGELVSELEAVWLTDVKKARVLKLVDKTEGTSYIHRKGLSHE